MIYVYFVSGSSLGNSFNGEVSLAREITTIKDIHDIENYLMKENPNMSSCVILNYQLLRTKNTEDTTETTAE